MAGLDGPEDDVLGLERLNGIRLQLIVAGKALVQAHNALRLFCRPLPESVPE